MTVDKIRRTKELAALLANVDGPHDVDDCPYYYDGCHCVEFLAADTKAIIAELENAQERISELEARQCYNLPLIVSTIRDGDRDVIHFGDGPESWSLIPTCSASVHEVVESMRRSIGRCHDKLLRDLEQARVKIENEEKFE